jgi:hypothetical protein
VIPSMPSALSTPTQAPTTEATSARRGHGGIERLIQAGEWILVLAAFAYIGGRALPRAWSHLNTDFPNYYLTARLLREGDRTSRIYEWIWLQRQKDRMGIKASDQPLVGFLPDTPFSALLVWPLTSWSPLAAKRVWIVLNLILLGLVAVMLRSITQLPWRRIALLIGLCYPVLRNLEYGQYYLVLLALLTLALQFYLQGRNCLAGILVGIAGGLKIFPAIFLLYFVRKRNVPAAIGLVLGLGFTVIASIAAFGLELHKTYLVQILPWALRGEALDPYNLALNSLSALLHKLFLFEPAWNPHPLMHSPAVFAVLHPLLQLAALAPAIFLVRPGDGQPEQLRLEWSSFLIALLGISTLPASYHFILLLLPVSVLAATFMRREQYSHLALLFLLYLAICFPAWPRPLDDGWWALLAVPRLYFVLLLLLLSYFALAQQRDSRREKGIERWAWAGALCMALAIQVAVTLRHQRGVYNYGSRIPMSSDIFLAATPAVRGNDLDFVAMRLYGYRVGSVDPVKNRFSSTVMDQLSITSSGNGLWIEEAALHSQVVHEDTNQQTRLEIADAGYPVASPDGKWVAYLRFNKGAGALWLKSLTQPDLSDSLLTPTEFDVLEMTFLPDGSLMFSASRNNQAPALYRVSRDGVIGAFDDANSRYPAASPDGQWLAYSELHEGVYLLWVRNLRDNTARQLTNAQCNNVSPAWQADSKTLIYASDCGRALGFTALYRKRVIP